MGRMLLPDYLRDIAGSNGSVVLCVNGSACGNGSVVSVVLVLTPGAYKQCSST